MALLLSPGYRFQAFDDLKVVVLELLSPSGLSHEEGGVSCQRPPSEFVAEEAAKLSISKRIWVRVRSPCLSFHLLAGTPRDSKDGTISYSQ